MKSSKSFRPRAHLPGILLIVAGGVFAFLAFGGANQRTDQGQILRWKPNTPIPYAINPGGVPGFSSELQRLVVIGAVRDFFRPWTEIPDAAITFNYSGTSTLTRGAIDGTNLVSFQDTSYPFPPGVLGVALVTSASGPGQVTVGSQVVNAEFAGQILDADIVFNPREPFSPVGANNTVDLIAVGIHEAGHFLGLDHTGVFSSIMNPFSESGAGIASRSVETDDTFIMANLYPAPTFAPSRGSIAGTITDSGGAPLKSAHVVAFSTTGGVPVASQLTGNDGRYSIDGLLPGNYHVFVEPLDGPISLADFPGFYSTGSANFATTFFPPSGTFNTVPVTAGQSTANVNIAAAARTASSLNIDELGISTTVGNTTSFLFGASPLFLPRGRSYNIFVTGPNLGSANLTAFGNGISAGATTGDTLPNNQPIRRQTLTISGSAPLGPSNLHLSNAGSTSVMAGGIITTVNPTIGTPLRNSGGFGTNLSPGTLVSIFGTDLARGRAPDGTEGWLGPPAPTSMGGISVKVGDRFAPLFFVSPGQINALIPYETTGTSTQITIVTGPNAQGNTVTVSLTPTAPGIFTVGGNQGAILNGTDNTVAAPVGTFPGSRPARPGEVVVIYASGMGPVTPSLPSGIGSGANGTAIPLMNNNPVVTIGGQPAAIQFAGLAPGFVGLYQLNVIVPSITVTGSEVPVTITTFQGQTSNIATMAVGP